MTTRRHATVPRVAGNNWSTVAVPGLGRWRPELTVSVVIPAYQCQASLDLTLAALAHQSYPPELLEVVVVDDGSQPPLRLPRRRPGRCRIVRPAQGWGRANALHHGVGESTGEILHWLDADLVTYPEHVEAQARWHHRLPYAVTLGWKRFVDVAPGSENWPTAEQVDAVCAAGRVGRLFPGVPSTGHDYVERMIARTRDLRDADQLGFLAHVGATAALRRELYEAAGGLDTGLRLGEDTEFGYRLAQAGAVFIPEPRARSWHLGASHMMRQQAELQRYNRPFLADRMPLPRWLRHTGGHSWSVPLVLAVVTATGQSFERTRTVVDGLLGGDEPDLRVCLVGPWHAVTGQHRPPHHDPLLDLRLTAACYRGEPRVRLVERAPETAYPSPWLLTVPAGYALARPAVRRMVEYADRHRLGRLDVPAAVGDGGGGPGPGGGTGGPGPAGGAVARLWRTAAVHRAGWVRGPGESLDGVVAALYGSRALSPRQVGLVDLSRHSDAALADGRVVASAASGRWLPATVEVAGLRSLLRAAWLVARLAAVHAGRRLRPGRREPVRRA